LYSRLILQIIEVSLSPSSLCFSAQVDSHLVKVRFQVCHLGLWCFEGLLHIPMGSKEYCTTHETKIKTINPDLVG
jgi:hypothetical protein